MQLTSSPGRALGLVAAGTIALSTAFAGVVGVAHADPQSPTVTQPPTVQAGTSVPSTPTNFGVFLVDDGAVYLGFYAGPADPAVHADTTGYEVTTDGGTTWGPLTLEPGSEYMQTAWVTGLENKREYQFAVRATSTAGPSLPTATRPATPAKPIGAPGSVTATSWNGKVTVRWTAPTVQGSYALDEYMVDLWNDGLPHGGEMEGPVCVAAATELTCTGDMPAGTGWQAMVTAVDTAGNWGITSDEVDVAAATSNPNPTPAPDAPKADAVVGQVTNLVATTSRTSITVTWDAPKTKGDHAVGRYVVGWGTGQTGDMACGVAATEARTCTFDATAGQEYTVSVFTEDTAGNTGNPVSVVVTAGVPTARPMPATVPASNGTITRPAGQPGSVAAGEKVTLRGSGYKPNSSVTVAIYSEPQVLTTVFTDADGSFEVTVTVPAGLAAGTHTLVASGVDKDGNVRNLTLPVTVAANGQAALADTGADIALPLAAGTAALLLGSGLLVAARRRSAV